MAKRGKQADEARERFAQLVLENKEQLFSSFSTKVTSESKKKCWEEIRNNLVAAGALQYADKNADDMRALYSDMKRRTLNKMHLSKTTGAGRVVLKQVSLLKVIFEIDDYIKVDKLILDIVGRDSPAILGLPVADAGKQPSRDELQLLQKGDNAETGVVKQSQQNLLSFEERRHQNLWPDSDSDIEVDVTTIMTEFSPNSSSATQASGLQNFLQNVNNAGFILNGLNYIFRN